MAQLPGYTRGLAFIGPYAFIGLSKIRERSVFGGLPIEERRADLHCGIRVVDTRTGQIIAGLDFHSRRRGNLRGGVPGRASGLQP